MPARTVARPAAGVPLATGLAAFGHRVAVVDGDREVTYAALAELVAAAVDRLGPTRRLVLVPASNDLHPLVWYLAALAGGHPVLLAPGDQPAHVAALVSRYDPDVVVGPAAGPAGIEERRPGTAHELHPDLALLLSTSGSTGSAKVVRLAGSSVQANAEAIATYLGLGDDDRAVTTLPMHYCYGLSVVNSHLAVGAGLVLTDRSVVDACFWDVVRRHRVTSIAGVPHTFDLLDRVGVERLSVPSLRRVTQAGGRLAPDRVLRYAELGRRSGWDLVVMYGQTEATARMAYLPPALATSHPASIGVPIPGGSFELEPVDGEPDDVGELVYRGPNVMLGYAEGPADLRLGRTVTALRTGDLARRGADGLYEVVGRRSRFLKLFGLRIDPQQVEDLLAARGVAALCTGDDRELVVAAAPGAEPVAVRRLVAGDVGLPAGAVRVLTVDPLPRLPNGKPDHRAVLAAAHAARADEAATEEGGAVGVREVLAEVLDRPDIDDDATFVDLGGDSLSYVEASLRLEDVLGTLPAGWHTMPVHRLEAVGRERRRGPSRWKQVETNVVLRAVAIVLVVGTHAELFEQRGGAHVLLAIAGFNFARFQLAPSRDGVAHMVASVARIAIPAVCWIAALVAVTDDYSLANVVLLNGHLGSEVFDERWRYWFVEVLVQLLVVLAAVFSVPAVRRLERRHAFGVALAVVLAGLAVRFDVVGFLSTRHHTVQTQTIAWVFAIGWAAERARATWQRVVVSLLAVVSVPGFFFDESARQVLIAGGVLLLVWLPTVAVPRPLDRLLAPVAAASLYVYLTHWHVQPPLEVHSPLLAVVASLLVGTAVWWSVQWVSRVRSRGGLLHGFRWTEPAVLRLVVPHVRQPARAGGDVPADAGRRPPGAAGAASRPGRRRGVRHRVADDPPGRRARGPHRRVRLLVGDGGEGGPPQPGTGVGPG